MAGRDDDQIPEGARRGNCEECGAPLASDQRYCTACGARRGLLPGAVAATLAAARSRRAGAAPPEKPGVKGDAKGNGGWSWMPSPPAIAIAVIGMLALGVGLGSAMSEVAISAPLSTILLEYPRHATEAPEAEPPEPEAEEDEEVAEEEPLVAEAPVEEEVTLPAEVATEPLPEEAVEEPLPEGEEEESALQKSLRESEEEQKQIEEEGLLGGEEGALPKPKHVWLIVLGENSYEGTYSAAAEAPYLTRTLPKQGELVPGYYGVASGVLANEVALLSGQGPTPETAANCPNPAPVAPATVSLFAEQIEGNGCLYPSTVKTLPTELEEAGLTWRSYSEGMEDGGAVGQPWRCRRPTIGVPDPPPVPGDQYANPRNPAVYFGAVTEDLGACESHDVGFEVLTKDLAARKKTPALSLIFPDACHSGGETECEPGAPSGAKGVAGLLKTLVPAIMASPAYEEGGGLIAITSAQAPQAGPHPDPSACCLAPQYPNLPAVPPPAEAEPGIFASGGGGKVGLLLISPLVEAGKVDETERADHFSLLKTLATMFGVEPPGYAAEEGVKTLSPELFLEPAPAETAETEEEAAQETAETTSRTASPSSATPRNLRIVGPVKRRDRRAPS